MAAVVSPLKVSVNVVVPLARVPPKFSDCWAFTSALARLPLPVSVSVPPLTVVPPL